MTRFVRLSAHAEEGILRNALWWADNHSIDEAIEWDPLFAGSCFKSPTNPKVTVFHPKRLYRNIQFETRWWGKEEKAVIEPSSLLTVTRS